MLLHTETRADSSAIISAHLFEEICQRLPGNVCDTPDYLQLSRELCVPVDTLASIHSQACQRYVKMQHHVHKGHSYEYCQRYVAGEDICAIADDVNFPPCIILRLVLDNLQLGLSKEAVKQVLNYPAALASRVQVDVSAEELDRLQGNIEEARVQDRMYSPFMDNVRRLSGVEYEALLCQQLRNANVPFWSEDELRRKGFVKTPDVKLQLPIAVDGHIVHWIDSKATFGDEKSHRNQYMDQYQQYVNRYGPGMVIYWFGFTRELQDDDDIPVLLRESFPETLQMLEMCTTA
mmetsp:Transcript_510/g.868  ORF Transcript_510/g.868 Transcript_510/m.868 type:complete len:291 (-) Transcript_510:436-1308(-)|eukprot:CAMPEP_0177774286 /NCGR_PEP_ID=MMETSP0491_2-20121128/13402_1 /TAXON_ID=63592 /ORGANISM="Tetraselmis chuii, Strain PLY429" /LENGTH=290 /DNA_ID=CAMNT_0019292607 /DNA_START=258 /DNA_END=1130 /DNA_ORIENTATION=+